jgi:hypothetical protein
VQVRRAVHALEAEGLRDTSGVLALDIFISAVRLRGDEADAFVRVDAKGTHRGTKLSCRCIERLHLRRRGGAWVVERPVLPRLEGVLDALEARHAAFEAREVSAYAEWMAKTYAGGREQALQRLRRLFSGDEVAHQVIEERVLRVEARRAQVTESFRLILETRSGREERRGRAAYVLVPGPHGWRFQSGLL